MLVLVVLARTVLLLLLLLMLLVLLLLLLTLPCPRTAAHEQRRALRAVLPLDRAGIFHNDRCSCCLHKDP